MLEQRNIGQKVEVCVVQGLGFNCLCQPPAVVSSFILTVCGLHQEAIGSQQGGVGQWCVPTLATAAQQYMHKVCRNQQRWHERK